MRSSHPFLFFQRQQRLNLMNQQQHAKILHLPDTATRLGVVLDLLDELHSLASEDNLSALGNIAKSELVDWLRDVIYTAEETIAEIQQQDLRPHRTAKSAHKVIYLERAE